MRLSLTKLRNNLYKIVDEVIEKGIPVVIERKGKKVKIVRVQNKSKIENLVKHPGTLIGDPEQIVHMDWSAEWKGAQPR